VFELEMELVKVLSSDLHLLVACTKVIDEMESSRSVRGGNKIKQCTAKLKRLEVELLLARGGRLNLAAKGCNILWHVL
jgi:hypothetical protein